MPRNQVNLESKLMQQNLNTEHLTNQQYNLRDFEPHLDPNSITGAHQKRLNFMKQHVL